MTRSRMGALARRLRSTPRIRSLLPAVCSLGVVVFGGCQTVAQGTAARSATTASTAPNVGSETPNDEIKRVSWAESVNRSATSAMDFVTGREQENLDRAKQLYQDGDQVFREAKAQTGGQAEKRYRRAAKLFRRAGEAARGKGIEQDALFMQAESLFFANRLTDATDAYQKLQKEYPRSRHNDRVAARLFAISRYWIETAKVDQQRWFNLNLTDPKRPFTDADGHAIRVLDQIRFDDPTGRLADDATMAAAAEYIRQEKFEEADDFLNDIRTAFSDSDHFFLAHLLGVQTKLRVYEGPRYSGLVLEEAEKLVQQTRSRFPDRVSDPKYGDMLARASAEIAFLKAERLDYRATYRERRGEYGAARSIYQNLLELPGQTPFHEKARQRLGAIAEYPAVPTQRLSWLTTIFPDSTRSVPLEMEGGDQKQQQPQNSGTLLR